jgi:16S rRNA (guanine527-N7)-methyltransferase
VNRVADIALEYGVPDAEAPLSALLELIASDDDAPTAVRDVRIGADVHVADSLVALNLPEVRTARWIVDIGSGVGFPGLALAAALPEARVVLLEAARRKAAWLDRAAQVVGLPNADAVAARVEEWHAGFGLQDVATARAVAALAVLIEYAAPLLRDGGVLVAWKGRRDTVEERDGVAAAQRLGMAVDEVLPVTPYPGSRDRHLHIVRKVRETPPGYPRAPGRARKRPIAADR